MQINNDIIHYGVRSNRFGGMLNTTSGLFQNGGEKMDKVQMHKDICQELTDLYSRKNADYGDSFAELRKEFPNSICLRLTDKLNRLKKLTDPNTEQKVSDESVEDTLKDIANYAILELIERKIEPEKIEETPNYRKVLIVKFDPKSRFLELTYYDTIGCQSEHSEETIEFYPNRSNMVFTLGNAIYNFFTEFKYDPDWEEIDDETHLKNSIIIASDLVDRKRNFIYDFEDPENIEEL